MITARTASSPRDSVRVHLAFAAIAVLVFAANWALVGPLQPIHRLGVSEGAIAADLLVLLPGLFLWLNRRRGRVAWVGAAMVFGFGVLAGSWLVPREHQVLWPWLVQFRLLLVALMVLAQAFVIGVLVREVFRASEQDNPEARIDLAVMRRFGATGVGGLLRLEARMWLYALAHKPVRWRFPGVAHFHGSMQHQNASNQQAFLILGAAEIPLMHLVMHFVNPVAALVISALSLYGFMALLAEYRATVHRPVSLEHDALHVRSGVIHDFRIPLLQMVSIEPSSTRARRVPGRIRAYGMGQANVKITLAPGTLLEGPFGPRDINEVLLGVDEPEALIAALQAARQEALLPHA